MVSNRFSRKQFNISQSRVRSKKKTFLIPNFPERESRRIEAQIRKTFSVCSNLFRKDAIDEADLFQEVALVAHETLKQYHNKEEDELIKLVHMRADWKMNELIRNAMRSNKIFANISTTEPIGIDNNEMCTIENTLISSHHKHNFLKIAYLVCDDKEYDILYKKFVENRIFEEIAEDYNVSKQRIEQIYVKAINKIRKRLNIKVIKKTSKEWNKQEKFKIIVPSGWKRKTLSTLSHEWFTEEITKDDFYERIRLSSCKLTKKQLLSWKMKDKLTSEENKKRTKILKKMRGNNNGSNNKRFK